MSFLSGPECSTGGNPLTQFTKHVQDDRSLQRDRLVGTGQGGLQESFRTQREGSPQEEALQNFLQHNGQLHDEAAHSFAMDSLRRDLDGYRMRSPQTASPLWGQEFDAQEHEKMAAAFHKPLSAGLSPSTFSPAEFQRFQQAVGKGKAKTYTSPPPSRMMPSYQRPMGMSYGMGMSAYRPMSAQQRPPEVTANGKGKERMVELDDQDWEKQFKEMDKAEEAIYQETRDEQLDAEANAALERDIDGMDRTLLSDEERMHLADNLPLNTDYDRWSQFDEQFARPFNDPQLGNYMFEPENLFSGTSNPYETGQQIIAEGGNLSLAALAFEAAVQQDPKHTNAWVALGSAQAQNEKETPAIRALEQAVKLDPENLESLMGLAISYTNDGWDSTAYRTLERWLATKYPSIISPGHLTQDSELGFTDRHLLHERVTELFIRAAQLSPDGQHMDPDVQVGLGVLFYGQEEYSKAVDCFEAALASSELGVSNRHSDRHLLWNRLGATLANSGRSEEATEAYYKALELKPNFVRARYNLGVSCINMNLWPEAAGHLLGAMSMHRVVERVGEEKVKEIVGMGGPAGGRGGENGPLDEGAIRHMVGMNESSNLLETLRRVFGNMGRRDLAERVVPGMDVESFRGQFDF